MRVQGTVISCSLTSCLYRVTVCCVYCGAAGAQAAGAQAVPQLLSQPPQLVAQAEAPQLLPQDWRRWPAAWAGTSPASSSPATSRDVVRGRVMNELREQGRDI